MIDELVSRTRGRATGTLGTDASARPRLRLAVVACMDSRIDVFGLLRLGRGDAHVIRNAGGIVTDDVIRSLTISQRLLGTTEVMLIHHTGCGLLDVAEDEVLAELERETGLRPPFRLGAFTDLEGDLRQSMARIRSDPFILHKGVVRAFVYDVQTGGLTEVVSPPD